jgi:hypothetical protein
LLNRCTSLSCERAGGPAGLRRAPRLSHIVASISAGSQWLPPTFVPSGITGFLLLARQLHIPVSHPVGPRLTQHHRDGETVGYASRTPAITPGPGHAVTYANGGGKPVGNSEDNEGSSPQRELTARTRLLIIGSRRDLWICNDQSVVVHVTNRGPVQRPRHRPA